MDASLVFLFYFAALFGGVLTSFPNPAPPLFHGFPGAVFGCKRDGRLVSFHCKGGGARLSFSTPFFDSHAAILRRIPNPGQGSVFICIKPHPANSAPLCPSCSLSP